MKTENKILLFAKIHENQFQSHPSQEIVSFTEEMGLQDPLTTKMATVTGRTKGAFQRVGPPGDVLKRLPRVHTRILEILFAVNCVSF